MSALPPSPWTVSAAVEGYRAPSTDGADDLQIIASDNVCVAIVWDSVFCDQHRKIARLIAAAPDLLEALSKLVHACTPMDAEPNARGEIRSVRTPDWISVTEARAALVKAGVL